MFDTYTITTAKPIRYKKHQGGTGVIPQGTQLSATLEYGKKNLTISLPGDAEKRSRRLSDEFVATRTWNAKPFQ